jgi:signal transduction histidine kinase
MTSVPNPSITPLSAVERDALRRGKGSRLPFFFVLVSLTFAIALPRIAQRRIDRLRNEINGVANPARLDLTEIQRDIALEASQRRGFLLTGDQPMAAHFVESRARRVGEEIQLIDYTRRLDSANDSVMLRAARRIKDLDRDLDSLLAAGFSHSVSAATLEEQRRRFLIIQALTDSLGAGIDRAADARRAAIGKTETFVATLSAALLLVGLGAAFLVARLGSKFRTLAVRLDESEARYHQIADSERAARTVAEQRQLDLERVTASRNRLLRGFTHDVKNPLGAADGYLALLHDGVMGEVADQPRAVLAKVRRSIGQALELIRQLLEIARAEAGELEIRPRSTDVVELVREVADSFQGQAAAKQHTLRTELPVSSPCLETDPSRLRQVVGNLVSNAVKYTPNGGRITVRVGMKPDDAAGDCWDVVIAVSDNGLGIPAAKLPMLFTEFTRFDPAAAEGAGIGLAISKKIAQALGGDIVVESVVENGTTFSLHLRSVRTALP